MKVIALTGGIGSGKSVVSAMLRVMGYRVYDCDSRARSLMDGSQEIKNKLVREFGADAVSPAGEIDRKYIAGRVFGDGEALRRLNGIVHPAVRQDLQQWVADGTACGCSCVFVETAILRNSNLRDLVSYEWNVHAPVEVRVGRVMKRNGLPREAVEARIKAQAGEEPGEGASIIVNDGISAVLPQVTTLLEKIKVGF